MKSLKQLTAALALAGLSTVAMAVGNPLSVHILSLQTGTPVSGVTVTLEQKEGDKWQELNHAETNAQGRVTELFPADKTFKTGDYRVVFKTGAYYQSIKQDTFFPEIPVPFRVQNAGQHYHIPLLLSPYGYSTYRGN
ncbi:hydroxyisourate hydrolase [Paraburkholderia bonniea]|uniref:hydroxyisourate hydrolase n=1 Tax=Paraburkholderia bonniea TaxID=2152891 RepID=UPI0012914C65|nr:hydroxyisourate hydrolase [Paraburkholderia bonniea]WJF89380.1 hydroxyisourate hydrolase [Paraburkholderia bonniea]WJF92695.1 hydroxyisourate hydrolase [Paraburkholderia bonniea]